jgi:predicted Zn-dependent protease
LNTLPVARLGRRSRVVLPVCALAWLLFAFIWHSWARHKSASAPGASGTTLGSRIELSIQDLAEPLRDLSPSDEEAFNEAVTLIQQKQHVLALAVLTPLTRSNPANSSLHIARAYVLLELGNVVGALGDAKQAEESGTHTAYKCWFLARVAYLSGNKPLCRREI